MNLLARPQPRKHTNIVFSYLHKHRRIQTKTTEYSKKDINEKRDISEEIRSQTPAGLNNEQSQKIQFYTIAEPFSVSFLSFLL